MLTTTAAVGLLGTETVIDVYFIGGGTKGYLLGEAISHYAATAARGAGAVGILATLLTLSGDSREIDKACENTIGEAIKKNTDVYTYINQKTPENERVMCKKHYDNMVGFESYCNSEVGKVSAFNKMSAEMDKNGKLTEEFLQSLVIYPTSQATYNKFNGDYFAGNKGMECFLNGMFEGATYKPSWIMGGSMDNSKITTFFKENRKKLQDKIDAFKLTLTKHTDGFYYDSEGNKYKLNNDGTYERVTNSTSSSTSRMNKSYLYDGCFDGQIRINSMTNYNPPGLFFKSYDAGSFCSSGSFNTNRDNQIKQDVSGDIEYQSLKNAINQGCNNCTEGQRDDFYNQILANGGTIVGAENAKHNPNSPSSPTAPSTNTSGDTTSSVNPLNGNTLSDAGFYSNSSGSCNGVSTNPYQVNNKNLPGRPELHGSSFVCEFATLSGLPDGNCDNANQVATDLCKAGVINNRRDCSANKSGTPPDGWSWTKPDSCPNEGESVITWNFKCTVESFSCDNQGWLYKCGIAEDNLPLVCANAAENYGEIGSEWSAGNECKEGDPESTLTLDNSDPEKPTLVEGGDGEVCYVKCTDNCTTPEDCEDECETCDTDTGTCVPDLDKASNPECGGDNGGGGDCDYIDCEECIESIEGEKCKYYNPSTQGCNVGDYVGYVGNYNGEEVCDKCEEKSAPWRPYDREFDSSEECWNKTTNSNTFSCPKKLKDELPWYSPQSKCKPGSTSCSHTFAEQAQDSVCSPKNDSSKWQDGSYTLREVNSCKENKAYCRPLKAQYTIVNEDSGEGSYASCLSRASSGSEYLKLTFNREKGQQCEDVESGSYEANKDSGTEFDICLNPCKCEVPIDSEGYTFHLELADDFKGNNDGKFQLNADTGRCEAKWSALPDGNGVNGKENKWGEAGTNGRWVIEGFEGTGWQQQTNEDECYFTCKGTASGAECYDQLLNVNVRFIPDLRVAVYNDPDFQALPTDQGDEANCAVNGQESTGDTTKNISLDNNQNKRDFIFFLGQQGSEAGYQGIYREKVAIYRHIFPNPFTSTGYYSEMTSGEDIKGQTADFSNTITNQYTKDTDTGYWTCTCPYSDPNNPDIHDCQLTFPLQTDAQICTSKRVYTAFRSCYTSAWWQVSGGNVYAYSDIVDAVPTQISPNDSCENNEYKCIDTATPPGHIQDFNPAETDQIVADDQSCTPRIIRGRTPCKTDGPSNSAGIALSQAGAVIAVDYDDCRINGNCNNVPAHYVDILAQRVSERSNIHALYQGNYSPANATTNPAGLQSKIGNSRVIPYLTDKTNSAGTKDTPHNQATNGFKPPREDYRYFVALFGGAEKLRTTEIVATGITTSDTKNFTSVEVSLDNIDNWCNNPANLVDSSSDFDTRVCYIPGNLTLSTSNPWHLKKGDKFRNYTFFIAGDLNLTSSNDNHSAVTAVDIGNFLAFIVQGNIHVDHNVGITMPDPTSENLNKCWEGQSATLGNLDSQANNTNSTAASAEGIFIASGNITVDSVLNSTNRNDADTSACRFEKRFIGQGSFISWGSVRLLRDFNQREGACQNDAYGAYNNRVPAETFIYRPDLVRNAPSWMKRQVTTYTEI